MVFKGRRKIRKSLKVLTCVQWVYDEFTERKSRKWFFVKVSYFWEICHGPGLGSHKPILIIPRDGSLCVDQSPSESFSRIQSPLEMYRVFSNLCVCVCIYSCFYNYTEDLCRK